MTRWPLPRWWLAVGPAPMEPTGTGLWRNLERPSETGAGGQLAGGHLWQELKSRLDPAQLRPARAEGVLVRELRDRAGPYYVLKNPRAPTYLRLSPREFWLWERMDGTRSVRELVLAYFQEHGGFAFGLILGLVGQLSAQQMLRDPPQALLSAVARSLAERALWHKFTWPARVVFTRELAISGLDRLLGHLMGAGGWVLYSLPARVLFLLLTLWGLYSFTGMVGDTRLRLLGENAGIGLIGFWLVAIVATVVHELGHALTTKHYGREVHRGGLILYYGMPAAFTDTTDMWMEGKGPRLAVAWAGPYSELVLGGFCFALVWLGPDLTIAPFLGQLAFISVLSALMNLHPLLKLDGYYLLSDAFELPQLRERSLGFIRHRLLAKLRGRERFSGEEVAFLIFGVLGVAWTAYFVYLSVVFWNGRVGPSVQATLAGRGDLATLLVTALVMLLTGSLLAWVGYWSYRLARALVEQVRRSGVLAKPKRAGLAIGLGVAVLAIAPQLAGREVATWLSLVLGLPAFTLAVVLALRLARQMRGAGCASAWQIFAGSLALLGLAHVLWGLPGLAVEGAAWAMDLAALALGAIALALGGRLLFGLGASWRATSALILGFGLLGLIGLLALSAAGLDREANAAHLLTGLALLGGLVHWSAAPRSPVAPAQAVDQQRTTQERLWEAFGRLAAEVLAQLQARYGRGAARGVGARVDRIARARGWDLTLTVWHPRLAASPGGEGEAASRVPPGGMTVDDAGELLTAALVILLDETERAVGTAFTREALARGYDALDWAERELTAEYVLQQMGGRAVGLAQQFTATRDDLVALLRRMPLFAAFTPEEIHAVGARLRTENFGQGEVIIRQGDRGDRFYILRRGRVEVTQRDGRGLEHSVNELVRGDYFGEAALLTAARRTATVRALSPVEALGLGKADFDRLLRPGFEGHDKVDRALRRVGLLRRIPIFAELEGLELQRLAAQLEPSTVDAGQIVVRQRDPADKFYIIDEGEVAVTLRLDGDTVEQARLGPGEYFGEVALLMRVPRTATVAATRPTTLLALGREPFEVLVRNAPALGRALERAASRRILLDLRRSGRPLAERLGCGRGASVLA